MFRAIGIIVTVLVGGFILLGIIGASIEQQHRDEAPSTLSSVPSTPNATANIMALLGETPSGSTPVPTEDTNGYRAFCNDQWTKRGALNVEMANYCYKQQGEGYEKLVGLIQADGGYSWMPDLVAGAMQKWTKRGSRQDEMVSYEVNEQIEAFKDLQYMASRSPGIKVGVGNDCLSQWTKEYIQWDMVKYCYNRTLGLN